MERREYYLENTAHIVGRKSINRAKEIIELILAVLCPVLILSFCSLRNDRAFGGTKWEFLVHSATIDGDIWPYIILILFIVEIICIVRMIFIFANSR